MCGGALAACVAVMNAQHNRIMRELEKPKTIRDMMFKLLKLKMQHKYNNRHIYEILDNISLTSKMGTEDIEQLINMMSRFHWELSLFAIPTWEWINNFAKLLKNKKVLEFGAGTGIITAMLREKGIKIRAIDNNNRELPRLIDNMIIDEGVKYIKEHKNEYDVLFFAWPEMNDTCVKACNIFLKNDKQIYYLGEHEGGCTANDRFFEKFNLEEVKVGYTPLFGLHDFLYEVKKITS